MHETVFVGRDIWSRKRGNAVKKQHYLFLIKYYMSALCVWNHMIPLFLALWPHVWSHAFLWFSVLHHTLKPAWMGSHHKETVALFSLSLSFFVFFVGKNGYKTFSHLHCSGVRNPSLFPLQAKMCCGLTVVIIVFGSDGGRILAGRQFPLFHLALRSGSKTFYDLTRFGDMTMHLQCTWLSMLIRPDHGLLVTLESLEVKYPLMPHSCQFTIGYCCPNRPQTAMADSASIFKWD